MLVERVVRKNPHWKMTLIPPVQKRLCWAFILALSCPTVAGTPSDGPTKRLTRVEVKDALRYVVALRSLPA
jgi:hypothetical protein